MCALQWASYWLFDLYSSSAQRTGSYRRNNGKENATSGQSGEMKASQFSLLSKVMKREALISVKQKRVQGLVRLYQYSQIITLVIQSRYLLQGGAFIKC